MKKAKVTVKGLGTTTLVLSFMLFIARVQISLPNFHTWVGGILIVFATMYVGAWLVTKGQTRN